MLVVLVLALTGHLVARSARGSGDARAAAGATLRVCADPNNLPFSNARGEGFENRLAALLADDWHAALEYTWWPQRRGFLRNTLQAGVCDVVIGMPAGVEQARTTTPYYRSTYVFVSRQGTLPGLASLDDPRLRTLRVGVQMIGDDFANSPPAHALAARGMTGNVVGFSVLGNYSQPNPPARIVDAVAGGEVDTALVWGPLAGYFARAAAPPLVVTPLSAGHDGPARPFTFAIAMAVRRDDGARQQRLDAFIARRRADIDRLLADYHVPRVDGSRPRGGS